MSGQGAELAGPFDGGVNDGVAIDELVEVAGVTGTGHVENLGLEHAPLPVGRGQPGLGEADGIPGQAHADGRLVQSDLGRQIGRADAGVARQAQQGAGSEGVAGHGSHDRLGMGEHPHHQLSAGTDQAARGVRALGHDRQIEPGGELAVPAHDRHRGGLGTGPVQAGMDGVDHRMGHGVRLAVVEADDGDAVIDGRGHGFGHAAIVSCGTAPTPTSGSRQTNRTPVGHDRGVPLDSRRCYDALCSRDARFDGRFWVGVRTTGVYCRPVCPSRTPLARNVDFYAHPAAAEDAGLRPCRRCRPDASPGSSEWSGAAAVVDRAIRLIEEGALDDGSVDDLAVRLHVGGRHLRRLFAEHLGTSPDAVARSRRAHLAGRLLAETDLRVADIAFSAGFGSVRQCNDVVRSTFHATPTQLRAARRGPLPSQGPARLQLRLAVRAPFDGDALLGWFTARSITGLETVTPTSYRRRIRVDDEAGSVELRPGPDHVSLSADLAPGTALGALVGGARRLFDLTAEPATIDEHLATDPTLAPLVAARPGIRVPGCWSGFEAAVRAVIGQQISVAAARTVLGRIVAAHGDDGAFPGPVDLVDAPLEGLGIIGRRAETIRLVSARVLDDALALDGSLDHDELIETLIAVPGIGPWTASYVALRSGEPDAFPAGDLHLRRMLGGGSERAVEARTQAWRPWRSYAAMHLWQTPFEGARS